MKIKFCLFNIIFSLFVIIAYNYPFWVKISEINGGPVFFAAVAVVVFSIVCIVGSLLFYPKTAKPFAIFLVLLSSVCFCFIHAYGIAIDKAMLLNVWQTDIYETRELINARFLITVALLGLLPSVLIYKTAIVYDAPKAGLLKRLVFVLVCAGLSGAVLGYDKAASKRFFRENQSLKYYLTPVNVFAAAVSLSKDIGRYTQDFVTISEGSRFRKYWDNDKKNLFALIIGESVRNQNFSLQGYNRPTNAPLRKNLDNIAYFSDFSACGTNTLISVQCMFSKNPREKFRELEGSYSENVLDILSKQGYKVVWNENNTACQDVCNRLEIEDFYIKHKSLDGVMLSRFDAKINRNPDKNILMVYHQLGSHGPNYFEKYTPEFELYKPTCKGDLKSCSVEEITNAYDNSITYTSSVINDTIEKLKSFSDRYNVVLLYVSDHGESLGEDGLYLHSLPVDKAPGYQTKVPFMVWMDDETYGALKIDKECLQKEAKSSYSHDNIFHSVLSLAGIDSPFYEKALDIFARCRKSEER